MPDLTVLENMFLPELSRPGRLDYRALRQQGEVILDALGQREGLPFDKEVRTLSSAQKQLVEIAKALGVRAKLIIFDEPTAALSPGEVERLFEVMERLRAQGRASSSCRTGWKRFFPSPTASRLCARGAPS